MKCNRSLVDSVNAFNHYSNETFHVHLVRNETLRGGDIGIVEKKKKTVLVQNMNKFRGFKQI